MGFDKIEINLEGILENHTHFFSLLVLKNL